MTVSADRFVLASHPVGEPAQDNFRLETLSPPSHNPERSWFVRSTCRSIPT
jgi:hypothetical protein